MKKDYFFLINLESYNWMYLLSHKFDIKITRDLSVGSQTPRLAEFLECRKG